jgi:hypothetical protein
MLLGMQHRTVFGGLKVFTRGQVTGSKVNCSAELGLIIEDIQSLCIVFINLYVLLSHVHSMITYCDCKIN